MSNVMIGCPTHDGRIDFRTAMAMFEDASREHHIRVVINQSSLLAKNCNMLWATAFNQMVKLNLEWFAMLHSDIIPEPLWVDKLINIANEKSADIVSVVVPIKSYEGLTSTALSGIDSFHPARRLTLKEVHALPETFGVSDLLQHSRFVMLPETKLLVNTGCMVCRLDRPYAKASHFSINDKIEFTDNNGYQAITEPEDWMFSRVAQMAGAKVIATRAVQVNHIGAALFDNSYPWGALETDKR